MKALQSCLPLGWGSQLFEFGATWIAIVIKQCDHVLRKEYKLVNMITFHPSPELFSGCLSKHALSIHYQHFVTPFLPVIFFMYTFHQDYSTPLIWGGLCAFGTLQPKHLYIALFCMPFLLCGIPCLMKLDIFSQPLHFKWSSFRRSICLKPISITASKFPNPIP